MTGFLSWFFYIIVMADVWEKIATEQRLSELLKLLEEQKEKEREHEIRDIAQEKKFGDRDIQLAGLIDVLSKHVLDLEKRVARLENKR